MVSGWMENGNINEFVKRDRHANRTELVRSMSPNPAKPLLSHRPDGRRCGWVEVYARSPDCPRRFERGINYSQMKFHHTDISLISEGEHPDQQGPASMYRRLRPYDYHWCRTSCWGLSGVVDLKRYTHVIHWRRDPPVDESRASGSGKVWDAAIRRQTDQTVRLLCPRDGYLRSGCSFERLRYRAQLTRDI